MVIGFSGSKTTEIVGSFFQARKANGTWLPRPMLVQAGRSAGIASPRDWGDYSATTIDPVDGSFWTVQQYGGIYQDLTFGPTDQRPFGPPGSAESALRQISLAREDEHETNPYFRDVNSQRESFGTSGDSVHQLPSALD